MPILPQSVNPNLPTTYPLRPRQQIRKKKMSSSLVSVLSGKLTILLVFTDTLIGPATAPRSKLHGPTFRSETNRVLTVHLRPVGRPYGSTTARWKAVRFIVRFIYGLSEGHMVHLRPVGRPYGSSTAHWKAVRFNYGPLEGRTVHCTVHLWSVGRLHGSFTARRQAIRFNYGPLEDRTVCLRPVGRLYGLFIVCWKAIWFTLWTISRTHGQFRVPFRRQPRRYLGRDFLRISFMFYGFIFLYFFYILWFY